MWMIAVIFIVLLLVGLPVAFVIGISGMSMFFLSGNDLMVFPQRFISGINSFPLLAIPLFILAGELMNVGGITNRIFDFARALVGHIRGGLGHSNIVASMVFAGMSGAAASDTAGLGTVEIKAMKEQKYPADFSAAVTVSSATIGPIIPPSINLIIYGSLASVSTGALFLGGIIPGVLMGLSLMILVYILAIRNNYPRDQRANLSKLMYTFRRAIVPLLTPAIILGGILFGIATPTEASVMAVVYALFLGVFVYRLVKWEDLLGILVRTSVLSASILLIIGIASPFGFMLSKLQIPQMFVEFILSLTDSTWLLWLLLLALLLFLGLFMEATAVMIILVPILLPTLTLFDIDLVHFGVVMSMALAIGLITPPVGICLFLGSKIAQIPVEHVIKAVIPFLIPLIIILIVVAFTPGMVTWLPEIFILSDGG